VPVELLEAAVELASGAGRLLLDHAGRAPSGVGTKTSGTDMVSDADRAAESWIVGRLGEWFPDDAIVGEESGSREGTSGRTWVIDPLDGTTNFLYGQDSWCVSVAVEDAEGPLAGCVFDPTRNESFSATRDAGAWLDGASLRASSITDLAEALVGTGFSYRADQREWQARVVGQLLPQVRDIRRRGAAALDLCWVAAGRLDAHVERGLAHWDHAAGLLVAAEAGAAIRRPATDEAWGLSAAGAPGIAERLYTLVDEAESLAGARPE
jgi:myo-inositol-1(or 4)-monophosphatase